MILPKKKRPEIYYFCSECEEFHHPDEIEDECDTSKYVFEESMDSFLSACASELERARKLREEANQLTSYHEGHEFVVEDLRKQGYFELIKKALEIELEVIQALKSKEVDKA